MQLAHMWALKWLFALGSDFVPALSVGDLQQCVGFVAPSLTCGLPRRPLGSHF